MLFVKVYEHKAIGEHYNRNVIFKTGEDYLLNFITDCPALGTIDHVPIKDNISILRL